MTQIKARVGAREQTVNAYVQRMEKYLNERAALWPKDKLGRDDEEGFRRWAQQAFAGMLRNLSHEVAILDK
jgi:nitrogen-specific signal transduction histidine kinase